MTQETMHHTCTITRVTLFMATVHAAMALIEVVYQRNPTVDRVCDPAALINLGTVRSQLGCGKACSQEPGCTSFFFNRNTRKCRGSNLVHADLTGCDVEVGVSYMYTQSIGLTLVGDPCSTDLDCPLQNTSCIQGQCVCVSPYIQTVNMSGCVLGTTNMGAPCIANSECSGDFVECWDNTCKCKPGYSHRADTNTCHDTCTTYGSTFLVYTDHTLACAGSPELTQVSIAECEAECLTTGCRTFRYNHNFIACKLDTCTPLTDPGAFGSYTGVDLYMRNCDLGG